MRIVYFVDSRYRDSIGAALVKKEILARKPDWEILLATYDLWKEVLELFNPHVAILNHTIGKRNEMIMQEVDYTIVMPTEGRPNTVGLLDWYVEKQDGKADLFLAWNEETANRFEKTETDVIGCPRYDVYHNRKDLIDDSYKALAKYGIDEDDFVVGVFTSFPQAKFSFSSVEFNQRDWKDLGVVSIDGREDPLAFARKEYNERQKFMTAIEALAQSGLVHPNRNVTFLVKPHPMEDVLMLQTWAEQHGFKIITQDSIHNVISACNLVINRVGCMTTIDAWLSECDVISVGTPEADGAAYESGVTVVKDAFALLNHMKSRKPENGKRYGEPIDTEYIARCGLDRGNASTRAAKSIIEHLSNIQVVSRDRVIPAQVRLRHIMTEHSQRNALPDPMSPPVGKVPTLGYLSGIEERVHEDESPTMFVVTAESELLIDRIINHNGRKIVFCLPQFETSFAQLGIPAIAIPKNSFSTEFRDKQFADYAMPGVLSDLELGHEFDGFEPWKALSIDRLRFWYDPLWENVQAMFDAVDYGEVVVSFDINSTIPWIAAESARLRGKRVSAIKTHPLTSREVIDFLRTKPIDELLVSYEKERQMLVKEAKGIVYKSYGADYKPRAAEAELLKKTIGIYFDSRFDWKLMVLFAELNLGDRHVYICVPNNREWKNFATTYPELLSAPQVTIADMPQLYKCAEVYMPSYIEAIVRNIPENAAITFFDIANTEKAGFFKEAMQ